MRCIAIDDESHNNEYLRECCSKIPSIKLLGTFTKPFEAIELLLSGTIDLVFLDFHIGGVDASEFLKELPPTIKVIIVSAELESKIWVYQMDILAVLNKPYTCDRLLEACRLGRKSRKRKG